MKSKWNDIEHLSASSVNDYLACGLMFKLARIDRVTPDFITEGRLMGTVIHRVLAEFHQARLMGGFMNVHEILDRFEDEWNKAAKGNSNILYQEGNTRESLLKQGQALLKTYHEHMTGESFTILAIEEVFEFTHDRLDVPIVGIIDLIEEDDSGTILITDHKTTSKAYSSDEVDGNFQMTVYQLAAQANGYADREIMLKLDCLVKTKTPKFERYYTTRSPNAGLKALKKIQAVWDGIQKQVFIPNDGSWKCKTCSYQSHCQAWFLGGAHDRAQ